MGDSHYQQAILEWALTGEGNAFAVGVAGCGKTYVCLRMVEELDERLNILMLAFNKAIATTTGKKLTEKGISNVESKTLHALGYRAMSDWLQWKCGRARINATKWRNSNILFRLMGGKEMSKEDNKLYKRIVMSVDKLVGLAKNLCIFDAQEFKQRIPALVDYYEIDIDPKIEEHVEEWASQTFIESLEFKKERRGIEVSFDDMIYLPVLAANRDQGSRFQKFDWIIIDEAQDLNPTQIELLNLLGDSRKLFVGDPHQAIYGFRGSDGDTVNTLIESFDARQLPLSICYRCPTKVIEYAQQYVEQIEAAPDAIEGELKTKNMEEFREEAQAGELVLCRTNAPLVKECLKLIREGKKAFIKGKEIGETIAKIVTRCSENDKSMTTENLVQHLYVYMDKMMKQYEKRKQEQKKELLEDQVATIKVLIESAEEAKDNAITKDVLALIESIFVDDPTEGVVFSSIHKAKGLEADTVWCLPSKPRKTRHAWVTEQETNLLYVQCTRAMRRLFFVEVQ